MNSYQKGTLGGGLSTPSLLCLMLALLMTGGSSPRLLGAPNVALWDTLSPVSTLETIRPGNDWKVVPTDLLSLEADPPKASSDPGYYGRGYDFKGNAVIENRYLCAVVSPAANRVVIYAKPINAELNEKNREAAWVRTLELTPGEQGNSSGGGRQVEILQNVADEVALQIVSPGTKAPESRWILRVGRSDTVEIQTAADTKSLRLQSKLAYGIVPGLIGDDLILSPLEYPQASKLHVPSENFFVGLVDGESLQWVMTWPKGKQALTLGIGASSPGGRSIESVDFENDGKSFYLAVMQAPGVWHQEKLGPAHLEKDLKLAWKKPFPARWKTQFYEGEVKTSFVLRENKGQIWRGVPGSYSYPAWFEDDAAYFHLSKKVPPKGMALIYYLESQDTPPLIPVPLDVLQSTLGWSVSGEIADTAGRNLRAHHRRGGEGVRRACTCGCTEAIQAVFESGEEVSRKNDISGAVDDMKYFVQCHVSRIAEYQKFAEQMIQFLQAQGRDHPELKAYVEKLAETASQIPKEYAIQKENMKTLAYADELGKKTMDLTAKKDPGNLKAYMELLKDWREMGGAQDYVLAQCHTLTRKLCQEAGYLAVVQPEAMSVAEEVRSRCRKCLRNPDGYEIWANY